MINTTAKYNSLFLKQGYAQAISDYAVALADSNADVCWDHVVLTASNEAQAKNFRAQLQYRLKNGLLPQRTVYTVVPDPDGKRVGSGGATLNVLRKLAQIINQERNSENDSTPQNISHENIFAGKRILCIHSGGDSQRIPQYSVCGKLFSPVPRQLPDGSCSTLFDELMVAFTSLAPKIRDGMLVCSGDVLMLFDALQLDYFTDGAAALSVKTSAELGSHHGVYCSDSNGNVSRFLHKRTVSELNANGAVDTHGCVNIDTGAVILDSNILSELYSLVSTEATASKYINEKVRLSFYADFSYPLSSSATLPEYLLEAPDGVMSEELSEARRNIWNILSKHTMKLVCLSPAEFLHFGTTSELRHLMTSGITDYELLGWRTSVNSYIPDRLFDKLSAVNSYISESVTADGKCYIENSYISDDVHLGEGCIVSNSYIPRGMHVPADTVIHCVKLTSGKYAARIYSVNDNPKLHYHFGKKIQAPLWSSELFPICDTPEQALKASMCKYFHTPNCEELSKVPYTLISLERSFAEADSDWSFCQLDTLNEHIIPKNYLQVIKNGSTPYEVNRLLSGITDPQKLDRIMSIIISKADELSINSTDELSLKLRVYNALAKYTAASKGANRTLSQKCRQTVCSSVLTSLPKLSPVKTAPDGRVHLELPLRVNFGGGWTDTPPYCIENGGCVLNAAITLDDQLPVKITARRSDLRAITLSSVDRRHDLVITERNYADAYEFQNSRDPLSIHKAALAVCGLLPHNTLICNKYPALNSKFTSLGALLDSLGGFELSTEVQNVPEGSGLGTSSILAGGCVIALCKLFCIPISEEELWQTVLAIEQLISTGGGWQDQIGGLTDGIKLVTSAKGIKQTPYAEKLKLPKEFLNELEERYALIYTGQRRYSGNLLRDVMGRYISSDTKAAAILSQISDIAIDMKKALEASDIEHFSTLLDRHWEASVALDPDCTNDCIETLFSSISTLICGRMICGAGGGGFLQVILKKGVAFPELEQKLRQTFGECDIRAYRCHFFDR